MPGSGWRGIVIERKSWLWATISRWSDNRRSPLAIASRGWKWFRNPVHSWDNMLFSYAPVEVASTTTGEIETYWRPIIPLVIQGDADIVLCSALVDSGADISLIPKPIAETLGLKLQPCHGPSPIAFGGGAIKTYSTEAVLQISDGTDDVAWLARLLVFEADRTQEQNAILGHVGFFEFFRATFDSSLRQLELLPNANGKFIELDDEV